jgi:hypothetical protein
MMVHQLPAPWTVTRSTTMCRLTWYVPAGMNTDRCSALATAMVRSIAGAASRCPVGSAPKSRTDNDPCGCSSGLATSSKSARSTTYQAGSAPDDGTWNRTVSPALYVLPSSRRCSS